MILPTIDIVYLASMFDHQGGVYISKEILDRTPTPAYQMDVIFNNQDQKAMQEFRDKLNYLGSIYRYGNSWRWIISGTMAFELLDLILPYLRLKNKQVEVALRFLRTVGQSLHQGKRLKPAIIKERELCFQQMKSIKHGINNA